MIKIKWAELHTPLFLAGTNLQTKLDPHKRIGLEMLYNRSEKEFLVTYDTGKVKETAIIPLSNVACMIEGAVKDRPEVEVVKPVGNRISAQVESPQSHVFAGQGHGKK